MIKKISNYYYLFVGLYLCFIFIVIIFSLHLFANFYSFTNKSNSMNPSINEGSITIVKKMDNYHVGEIISYYSNINNKEQIITHRIMRIGGNVYLTKGDANLGFDAPIVLPRLIIGKVIMIIPYLGYVISFAKSALGLWISIIIPAVLIIYVEIIKIISILKNTKPIS